MKIVVSFTSYPARIDDVHRVVESLYRQTVPADEIVLYLSLEEFPHAETYLPEALRRLIGQGGFRVAWVPGNLKSHKKYFYALQEYREAVLITVDDDTIYGETMIGELVESHRRFPNAVAARKVRIMLRQGEELEPYRKWEREKYLEEYTDRPRMDLCAIGNGGICYPGLSGEQWFDPETILRIAGEQDDLWLKYHEIMDGIPVVYRKASQEDITIENSQGSTLASTNVFGEGNDRCIHSLSALFRKQCECGYRQGFQNVMTWEEYISKKKEYYAQAFGSVLDQAQNVPIYVYGAGKVAGRLLMVLEDLALLRRVTAILVSEKPGNPSNLYGLRVMSVSEVDTDRKFGVVFGVNEAHKREAMDQLAGYDHIELALDMRIIARYYPC